VITHFGITEVYFYNLLKMANLLKIEWWNDHDLGNILYQDGFKNRIFLDVEVEKPEYNTVIESDLNGDAVEIAKFRKWEKVYKFECWMQEDLVDAFSLMQIHDNIEVTLQSGDVIQVARHGLRVEPSWEEIGCLAKCIVSFTENYIVAGNCDENMEAGCFCETSGGDFYGIEPIANMPAFQNQYKYLVYTVEDIADKKYTASIYEFSVSHNAWVEIANPAQYTCWQNIYPNPDQTWIFDGQFWQLFPGYIIALTEPSGTEIKVEAWILPGTFGNIYYSKNGGGSVLVGAYTRDELDSGVTFTHTGAGTYDIWITVYNHSCAYLNTDFKEIII
jgi:hypothetical protein